MIVNREWQDIYQVNWQKSYDGEKIDKKFKGLKWLSNFKNTNNEMTKLKIICYLKSNKFNSIIITHTQIYNVLLNKKNFSPVKYWWKENTYQIKMRCKRKIRSFFKQKINQNKVKNVIILSDPAIGDFTKKDFKWLINCTQVDKKTQMNLEKFYWSLKNVKLFKQTLFYFLKQKNILKTDLIIC